VKVSVIMNCIHSQSYWPDLRLTLDQPTPTGVMPGKGEVPPGVPPSGADWQAA